MMLMFCDLFMGIYTRRWDTAVDMFGRLFGNQLSNLLS